MDEVGLGRLSELAGLGKGMYKDDMNEQIMAEDLQADDGEHYDSFDDFVGKFDADSFDDVEEHSAGREIRGYINGKCVMSWEYDDESMTSGYGNYDMTMLEDDRLMARTGINSVNKTPRPGQTNFREIPAGNHPGSQNKFSDEYRSSHTDRLKREIEKSLGKHAEPNLPESMASMLGRLDELAEAEQIDEVGNTPAGQAALRAVDARGTTAMDTWNKKPESGYTKAPKQTTKQFVGAMNADRRLHGFGPDASAKSRVQRQIDYAKSMQAREQGMTESVESHAGRLFRELQQFKG
jgi:hypothetical protein